MTYLNSESMMCLRAPLSQSIVLSVLSIATVHSKKQIGQFSTHVTILRRDIVFSTRGQKGTSFRPGLSGSLGKFSCTGSNKIFSPYSRVVVAPSISTTRTRIPYLQVTLFSVSRHQNWLRLELRALLILWLWQQGFTSSRISNRNSHVYSPFQNFSDKV